MKIIGEPEIPQPVHKQTVDKQIVIDTNPYRTRVALLEDGKTVELHIEQRSNDMLVGNIYKGRVSNVLPGMEAAFVDISEDIFATSRTSSFPGEPCCRSKKIRMSVRMLSPDRK